MTREFPLQIWNSGSPYLCQVEQVGEKDSLMAFPAALHLSHMTFPSSSSFILCDCGLPDAPLDPAVEQVGEKDSLMVFPAAVELKILGAGFHGDVIVLLGQVEQVGEKDSLMAFPAAVERVHQDRDSRRTRRREDRNRTG